MPAEPNQPVSVAAPRLFVSAPPQSSSPPPNACACQTNLFCPSVYLHANLCVITVHDTGNRRVKKCPSLFLSFHPALHINYLLCPAGWPKGGHLSPCRAAFIFLRLYDDDTKVDLVFIVFFSLFLFLCVRLCFCHFCFHCCVRRTLRLLFGGSQNNTRYFWALSSRQSPTETYVIIVQKDCNLLSFSPSI